MADLYSFIRESNRIEGIHREPLKRELEAHEAFLDLPEVRVPEIRCFVREIAERTGIPHQTVWTFVSGSRRAVALDDYEALEAER